MADDREILEAFKDEGRRDYAFNLLVRKYSRSLYWHIRRAVLNHDDADDLLQNTLIKAWRHLPEFREDSRLYTWLYRIATNETINFLRSKRLKTMFSMSGHERELTESLKADPYFHGDDIMARLYGAIAKLPPRQKMVFNMKYFEDMKFTEIAGILDRTTGSVKASYHQAYLKLRHLLDGSE
ncbi:MAG TPA: sigma-70 family RNA polymerase sigma factor [Candidatus Coprenecus stercoravium]|uniref:RNA polymerase sigma factor n=1 Tax=Candidatus Coprenecus stercoravium TaxID=2840735 RepID=A0A9D2GNG3_9BACT|nr:sigma-70 family RNA polymerase sigma factor [Candidatus Coprenecus stercoravium]